MTNEDEEGDGGITRLTLSQAKERNPKVKVGDYVEEPMESVEFGRIAAQKANK